MRVAVNYRKGQKHLKELLYIQSVPWPLRAYSEKLSVAFPDNPVGVTKPSFLKLFVLQDKRLWKSRQLGMTCFLTIFGNKSMRKVSSESKLAPNIVSYTLLNLFFNSSDMHDFEARQTHKTLDNQKFISKLNSFQKNFGQKLMENSGKLPANI